MLSTLLIGCTETQDNNAYNADIDFLIETLPQKHPNLFFSVSQEEFEQTFSDIKKMTGHRTAFEIIMALREATAKLGDPHTNFGFYEAVYSLGHFPFEVQPFSDGLYVLF